MIQPLYHHNGPVEVVVRSSARQITLRLDHALRRATLVLPHRRYARQGAKLLEQRSAWLSAQWHKLPPPMPFVPDGEILVHGEMVKLRHETGRGQARLQAGELVVPATRVEVFASRARRALISMAKDALETEVADHERNLGLSARRISVRDTRSRWGSCSAAGNLNFSWRLICTPLAVLSYVAAHEVAHLREANHGPAFWAEVAKTCAETSAPRKYLRDHGPQLFAIGADY